MLRMPPEKWRNLLARAVVFHATRDLVGRLSELADQVPEVARALLELEISAAEAADRYCEDAEAVGQVIKLWYDALGVALQSRILSPSARRLFDEMRLSLRDHVVDETGHDPFTVMLRSIEREAALLYRDAWRPTMLSVFHRRTHPRSALPTADPYPVTSAVVWPPAADAVEIELHVFCEKFGPAAYAVVPMLLTHECVCHVPARQDEPKADSPFAEGFLDWAAYYFLDAWAMKLDPRSGPAIRKHAQRLKVVLLGDAATAAGLARQVGHDAADNLLAWFEQRLALPHDAGRVRVADFAVRLNVVERPLADKDNLVSRLGWPLPPDLDQALIAWTNGAVSTEALLDTAASR
jgi:hypothetical protein